MKKILYMMIVCSCIGILVLGQIHWESKINGQFESQKVMAEENSNIHTITPEDPNDETDVIDYNHLTANLTTELRDIIMNALKQKKEIHIAVIGSDAQTKGKNPWPNLVQKELDKAYGENFFRLSEYSFENDPSINVHSSEKYNEIIESDFDIVLLEPFVLNDNHGRIASDDSITSIMLMKSKLENKNEDPILILQPPHPIFEPNVYDDQVKKIKMYADDNGIIFLNHWENWPDTNDEALNDYVLDDLSGPNDRGNEVWAEYISDYFTGM